MIKDVSDCYNFEALVVSSSTVELFLRMRNDSFMGVKGGVGCGAGARKGAFSSAFLSDSCGTEQGGIKWGIRGSGILDSEGSHR